MKRHAGGDVSLDPGEVVGGQYRVEGVLGAGGMGRVYLAMDLELEREVALKTMHCPRQGDDDRRKRRLQD